MTPFTYRNITGKFITAVDSNDKNYLNIELGNGKMIAAQSNKVIVDDSIEAGILKVVIMDNSFYRELFKFIFEGDLSAWKL